MKYLRTCHLIVGLIGITTFILSGQYMYHFLSHLKGMDDGPRLLYRSAHIYLSFASLLNLLLGSYLVPINQGWRRSLQLLASAMILTAPVLFGFSFFTESKVEDLNRPISKLEIFQAFVGCIIHMLISSSARRSDEDI